MKREKKGKYSCIVDTSYALFLYLLMCDDGDWNRTFYFVGDGIDDSLRQKLSKVVYFPSNKHNMYATFYLRLLIKIRALFWRFRYVGFSKIYAQDHLYYSSQLIGKQKYVLIEDAPGSYSMCETSIHKNIIPLPRGKRSRIRRLIEWGPIYGLYFGRNAQCINRWVTSPDDLNTPILNGTSTTLFSIKEKWKEASELKREYILKVFSISEEEIQWYRQCKTIIFTEPFEEFGLTYAEAAEVFRPYILQYKNDGLVIKPHPRDHMDWQSFFPDVRVLDAQIPMQIIGCMGINIDRAITVFSTAISGLKYETEIVWLGISAHPKLRAVIKKEIVCPFDGKFQTIKYGAQ